MNVSLSVTVNHLVAALRAFALAGADRRAREQAERRVGEPSAQSERSETS